MYKPLSSMEKLVLMSALLMILSVITAQPSENYSPSHYEINLPSIGKQIKKARLAKKMSRVKLAAAVGLSAYNIEKIEQGKAVPTRNIIYKIEALLGCKIQIKEI